MAYTTEAAVRAATGMTDTAKITSGTIALKIAYATNDIDSMVGSIYQLPITNVPDLIAMVALEMVSALLYMDEYGEETQNMDKGGQKKYLQMIAILEEIQSGKQKLYYNNVELPRNSLMLPSFYPTKTSSRRDAHNSTHPKLTMNMEF